MTRLTRFRPTYSLLNNLQDEINQLFSPLSQDVSNESAHSLAYDWTPAVDVKDEDDHFVIHADLPGVKATDIEVKMDNGTLTIKGKRHAEHKEEDKNKNYLRIECSSGSFMRRFSMPDNVDASQIKAKNKDGVLEVMLPKTKQHGEHTVKIETE